MVSADASAPTLRSDHGTVELEWWQNIRALEESQRREEGILCVCDYQVYLSWE